MELAGMEAAAANAAKLLNAFRQQALPIFHVRHIAARPGATFFLPETFGAELHTSVAPDEAEPVITKHLPNSFRQTNLHELLQAQNIRELTICGAMSHMCIDTTVRAAFDLGYSCTVAADACATRDLKFGDMTIPAAQVHGAFMAAISGIFAKVISTEEAICAL